MGSGAEPQPPSDFSQNLRVFQGLSTHFRAENWSQISQKSRFFPLFWAFLSVLSVKTPIFLFLVGFVGCWQPCIVTCFSLLARHRLDLRFPATKLLLDGVTPFSFCRPNDFLYPQHQQRLQHPSRDSSGRAGPAVSRVGLRCRKGMLRSN